MKFGAVPLQQAKGAILAHSMGPVKKGTLLEDTHLDSLQAAGFDAVIVAQLSSQDLHENEAARLLGDAIATPNAATTTAFTGRVNLVAKCAGVVLVDVKAINAANAIDEGLTTATLPNHMRVSADQLLATIKIIPYGLDKMLVAKGERALRNSITLCPFTPKTAHLILTETEGMKSSLLEKGARVISDRVAPLAISVEKTSVVPHTKEAVAKALSCSNADLTLVLGASATSDRSDIIPSGIIASGGKVSRFGMPVDPGNLLVMATVNQRPVIGLPGCARSPALNGADWVLERLAANIEISDQDIASMGVGGLLKEMPDRPSPRRQRKS